MIKRLNLIIQREFSATLQRKGVLFFMFGIPIILAIVSLIVYQVKKSPAAISVMDNMTQNNSQTHSTDGLPMGLVDPAGLMNLTPPGMQPLDFAPYEKEPKAVEDLKAGKLAAVLVIPETYALGDEPELFTLSANPLSQAINASQIGTILAYNLLKDEPGLAAVMMRPLDLNVTELPSKGQVENAVDSENWYISTLPLFMVILLYMVILVPAGNLVSGLTHEKKNRVMEILLCSVSPMELFVGKLLATGFVGFIQMILWVGLAWGVGKYGGSPLQIPEGYTIPIPLLGWSIVFAMLGYMMYAAQLAGVGALAPSNNESRSVTMLLMLPLIIGYSLSTVISSAPFSPLAYFLSFFPLTAPVAMIGRMAAVELPLWEPLISTLIQFIGVVIIVRLFGRLFQANLMLSGQQLTPKRLFVALSGKNQAIK